MGRSRLQLTMIGTALDSFLFGFAGPIVGGFTLMAVILLVRHWSTLLDDPTGRVVVACVVAVVFSDSMAVSDTDALHSGFIWFGLLVGIWVVVSAWKDLIK